jgi:hypothetical protein
MKRRYMGGDIQSVRDGKYCLSVGRHLDLCMNADDRIRVLTQQTLIMAES